MNTQIDIKKLATSSKARLRELKKMGFHVTGQTIDCNKHFEKVCIHLALAIHGLQATINIVTTKALGGVPFGHISKVNLTSNGLFTVATNFAEFKRAYNQYNNRIRNNN